MKILLTGGGTGGHVYPALAIAEAILELEPRAQLCYLGKADSFESKAVSRTSIEFRTISAGGIVGKSATARVRNLMAVAQGVIQAFGHLRSFAPDVIVGTGGYVMAPVILAAKLCRTPYVLQEQNSFPGLTTRSFAGGARCVCLGSADAARHLQNTRTVVTGNPVRRSLIEASRKAVLAPFINSRHRLLVVGGSLGARSINRAVAEGLDALARTSDITWQFGRSGLPEELPKELFATLTSNGILKASEFIDDMHLKYAAADLVICRAGALTLAELALFGLPAILIPFPHAAHQHQLNNAHAVEAAGAAAVLLDAELTGKRLCETVKSLLEDRDRLQQMSLAMRALGAPNAALDVARTAIECIRK